MRSIFNATNNFVFFYEETCVNTDCFCCFCLTSQRLKIHALSYGLSTFSFNGTGTGERTVNNFTSKFSHSHWNISCTSTKKNQKIRKQNKTKQLQCIEKITRGVKWLGKPFVSVTVHVQTQFKL